MVFLGNMHITCINEAEKTISFNDNFPLPDKDHGWPRGDPQISSTEQRKSLKHLKKASTGNSLVQPS